MKKFEMMKRPLLIAAMVAFGFIGCQKEEVVADATVTPNEATVINGTSTNGRFKGSIERSYADALAYNFAEKFDNNNQTLQVAFSEAELTAFIASLKTRFKSDIIYVNFGLYGKGAAPLDPKDNGRMTVFFTGNNMPKNGSKVKGFAIEGDADEFLNHGQIFP